MFNRTITRLNFSRKIKRSYADFYRKQQIRRRKIVAAVLITSVIAYEGSVYLKDYLEVESENKKKIVILGSGFAAMSILETINTKKYDVTVVSPRSYFLFTPLLTDTSLGFVKMESIVEPVRQFAKRNWKNFTFYEAFCNDIDPKKNTVTCKSKNGTTFELNYDQLIVAVGGVRNSYHTPGVNDNCYFLDNLSDAQDIRDSIIDAFENANIPGISDDIKRKNLHFVIIGGSPIAHEFASKLSDFAKGAEELNPHLKDYVSITLINGYNDHVKNFYDHSIADFNKKHYGRDNHINRKKLL